MRLVLAVRLRLRPPTRLYLGRGDGTFEDVTASSGIDVLNGYGLGIVAADFDGGDA